MTISLQYTNNTMVKAVLYCCLLVCINNCAFALQDSDEPVNIKSDKASFDHNDGLASYTGKVSVDQGSRHLLSDNLIIKRDQNNRIKVIIATGKPARFRSQPDPKKMISYGKANTIKYYPQQDKIDLLDDAELNQNGDTIKGPILNYNFTTGNLKTSSSIDERATFILQPKRP